MSKIVWVDPYDYSAGKPFRIFPIKKAKRGDREIDVTRERLAQMKENYESDRPRWKIPIYAGHPTDTNPDPPKLGNAASLELRDDGLYAVPEYTDEGKRSVSGGEYQYSSPGVLWSINGSFYTDDQGNEFDNVIDHIALTNRPYWGKDTMVFSSDPEVLEKNAEAGEIMERLTILEDRFQKLDEKVSEPNVENVTRSNTMSDITPEAFAELQKTVEVLTAAQKEKEEKFAAELEAANKQAEKLSEDNKSLSEKFANSEKARKMEALMVRADTFSHLPVNRDEFAEHFYALENTLPETAKWFAEKFAAFENMASTGNLFEQITRPDAKNEPETFDAFIEKVLTEKFDGDRAKYKEAVKEATRLNPKLANAHLGLS